MHRYDELEKLYYKKKIKKYFFVSSVVLLLALGCGAFYKNISSQNKILKNVDINDNTGIDNKHIKQKNHNGKKFVNFESKNNESKALIPNLTFVIPKINKKEINNHKNEIKKQNIVKKEQNKTIKQEVKKTMKQETNKTVKKPEIKKTAVIEERQMNIKDLIKLFQKEPTYETAMLVSNYYFNSKDYKNAKLWALKANSINPEKYQSWKMFALILLKKNDKIKAKEVLKIYLNDYGHNDEIYKLLRSIDE